MKLEEFINYVSYDPLTGEFTRTKILNDHPAHMWRLGETIGNASSRGYLEISVGEEKYSAHKLAWYITHGEYPNPSIDHINGDKQDNRIENLRLSTPLENMRNRGKNENNTTGYNGVYLSSSGRYRARIKINGKLIGLGTFDTVELAAAARKSANEKYNFDDDHGERDSWTTKTK